MVVFTCNKCGDSLKKKDCASHAGKCYPLALTCIDCHKDFFGDQFVAHTSCVTEAEKYGVKGFASRPPSTAGAAKQAEWSRAILSASEASGLTSYQKFFLGILTRHGNVPRKKKQFQNFTHSVWRDGARQGHVVDQVFAMLESELKKIKDPAKENDASKTTAKSNGDSEDKAIDNAVEPEVDNTAAKKAKEKKEKAMDNAGEPEVDNPASKKAKGKKEKAMDNVAEPEVSNTASKKHKGKKERSLDELRAIANGVEKKSEKEACVGVKDFIENEKEPELIPDNSENGTISKKSKKKKQKNQGAHVEEEVTQNGNGTVEEVKAEDDSTSTKSKKRKQKEALGEEEVSRNGNGTVEEESVKAEDDFTSTKSKKKKRKQKEALGEEEVARNGNETVEEESVKAEDDSTSTRKRKKSKKNKLAEVDENGSVELVVEELPKKSKKKKHKSKEENGTEATETVNGQEDTADDVAKDTIKKSKKKKHKLQEAEEAVPRKKSKSTGG